MATNCIINGNAYYKIDRKVGKKLKDGKWVDKYKTFYGANKKEALNKYNEYLKRQEKGTLDNRCFGELMDIYINEVFKKSKLANSTKKKYISANTRLLQPNDISGWNIHEVTSLHLQEFYNNLSECYSTRRALHNLLRHFYKYLDVNGIAKDVTHSLVVPKEKRIDTAKDEIITWTDNEVQQIIAALEGSTLRFLIVLAVNCGLRFSELLALTYDDIKDNTLYVNKQLSEISPVDSSDNTTLHIDYTKTSSSNRAIPLSQPIIDELERHKILQRSEMVQHGYITNYLFTTSNGTFYYRRNISRSLKRLYKRIGVQYKKFHAYRATCASNLARAGVPIEQTAKILGHSDISVTARYYIAVSADQRRDAIERITGYSLSVV